jgi:hypothetical protein
MAADYRLGGVIDLKDKTGPGAKSAQQNISGLEGAVNAAKAALFALGAQQAVRTAVELGRLGAQAERTESAFVNIAGGTDAAEDNLEAMREATRGAVDDMGLMQAANQMLQMGLADNAEELRRNATLATRLGGAMGKDAAGAMADWNMMMANQSIPRLDTFGISAGAVRMRMEELAEANQNLTREQRFSIAAAEEGEKALLRLGDAVEDNQLAIEQGQAAWQNFRVELGKNFSDAVGQATGALGLLLTEVTEGMAQVNDLREGMGEAATSAAYFAERYGGAAGALDNLNQRMIENQTINALSQGQMADYAAMEAAAARQREVLNTALSNTEPQARQNQLVDEYSRAVNAGNQVTAEYHERFDALAVQIDRTEEELARYNEMQERVQDSTRDAAVIQADLTRALEDQQWAAYQLEQAQEALRAAQDPGNAERAEFRVEKAQRRRTDATEELTEAEATLQELRGGYTSNEFASEEEYWAAVEEAQERVTDAQERLTETTFSLGDAQERLNEATDPDRQRELERAVTLAKRALENQKTQVSELRDELQTSPTMDDYADEITNAEAQLQRLKDKQREYGNTAREEFNRAIQNAGNYRNALDLLADHPIWSGDFQIPGVVGPQGGAQMTPAGGTQTIPSGSGNNITMYNPIFQGVGDTDNFFSELEDMQP